MELDMPANLYSLKIKVRATDTKLIFPLPCRKKVVRMNLLLIITAICAGIFYLGYHLGNQLGRTAHIRENLQRARDAHIVARIENQ